MQELFVLLVAYCIVYCLIQHKGSWGTRLVSAVVVCVLSFVSAIALLVVLNIPFTGGMCISLVAWSAYQLWRLNRQGDATAEYVDETMAFLDDFSHFMQGYLRYAAVYYSNTEHAIIADVTIFDAKVRKDTYESVYRRLSGDVTDKAINENYFGSYQPKTRFCYYIIDNATVEDGEDLHLRFALKAVKLHNVLLNDCLWEKIRQEYPNAERTGDLIRVRFHE